MKRFAATFLLTSITLLPIAALADAQINEWIGRYSMDHDGFVGTLSIQDSKQDCAAPAWCHLVLRYTDAKGQTWSGEVAVIDQKFQHMAFYINFPNNRQKFDGYLFSWDKTKMAGITYWGGRSFGFYALKS